MKDRYFNLTYRHFWAPSEHQWVHVWDYTQNRQHLLTGTPEVLLSRPLTPNDPAINLGTELQLHGNTLRYKDKQIVNTLQITFMSYVQFAKKTFAFALDVFYSISFSCLKHHHHSCKNIILNNNKSNNKHNIYWHKSSIASK